VTLDGGQKRRTLSDFVPGLRRRTPASVAANGLDGADRLRGAEIAPEPVFRSAALAGFLHAVGSRPAAELVDLGPVVGSNIAFLGERVRCKIHVADLYADLDRHARQDILDRFPGFLERRLPLPAESIDGVLCWDVFDYLETAAGSALAGELIRILRPGGALLGFFGATARQEPGFTRYVIEDAEHLRCRTYPAAAGRQRVLQNREVVKLFEGLRVSDSVLLKSQRREILFRKPLSAD
jgi:hypothetical protein